MTRTDGRATAHRTGPGRGTQGGRFSVLAAGLAGCLYLAGVGTTGSLLPAWLMLNAGHPGAAVALVLAGLLGGVVVIPVLIAPRILPPGAWLSRTIAPGLHGQLEMMRRRLGSPRVAGIVLDHGFEIRIAFGGRSLLSPRASRHLIIGLPLMHALSAAEFRALMAREIALSSRRHGRPLLWIALLREHWERLRIQSAASPILRWVGLHRFLRRYAPWFSGRARPCLLDREQAADRMACAIARRDELAAAILRCALARRFIDERVLPDLRSQIRRFGEPASGAHTRFELALRGAFDDPHFDRWLVDVLRPRQTTDECEAPHVRLDAIGFGMNRPEAFGHLLKQAFSTRKETDTAAGHYLGPGVRHVTVSLEKSWIDQIRCSASTPAATEHRPAHAGATAEEAGLRLRHPDDGGGPDVRRRPARSA